jgi:hypothetical protein
VSELSRPRLDALWTRAARLAAREGATLDELYVEETRRERSWSDAGALVERDAGMSVLLARGHTLSFRASAGLSAETLDALVAGSGGALGPASASPSNRSALNAASS